MRYENLASERKTYSAPLIKTSSHESHVTPYHQHSPVMPDSQSTKDIKVDPKPKAKRARICIVDTGWDPIHRAAFCLPVTTSLMPSFGGRYQKQNLSSWHRTFVSMSRSICSCFGGLVVSVGTNQSLSEFLGEPNPWIRYCLDKGLQALQVENLDGKVLCFQFNRFLTVNLWEKPLTPWEIILAQW